MALSRFSWHKVWTGVKCNFSSPHHHVRKIVGKLSNRRFLMWNFTMIGAKTKMLWLSIVSARRPSEHIGLGPPQKGVNCNFSWEHFQKRDTIGKLSISRVQMGNFTRIGPKTEKLWLLIFPVRRPSEQPGLGTHQKGVNCHFSSPKFDKPYRIRKLSISDTKICSFSRIGQMINKLQLL